jgi:DNA-binding response OmpR family regulator
MPEDSFNKILVVEDDMAFYDTLNSKLSAQGFVISNADNGEQAMEKLLFHQPRLVILDLLLPKGDGFSVLAKIRSYPDAAIANTPVVVLSNLSSEEDIKKAQAFNILEYYIKSQTSVDEVVKRAQEIVFGGETKPRTHYIDPTSIH